MKKGTASLLILALLASLALPFALPSGALLDERKTQLMEEVWEQEEQEESSLLRWLLPSAKAESTQEKEEAADIQPLPIDFTEGPKLDPANFREDGYEDASIKLVIETREIGGDTCRIAQVDIKDASQLRTATAGKPGSSKVALISSMAQKYNAVIAINANYMSNQPSKTSFEYRMGTKVRSKLNRTKDLLIIDENGDFHVLVKSQKEELDAFLDAGHQIINAFTFGPGLVKDGAALKIDKNYGYNPQGKEPRLAIGQLGPKSYLLVLVEGRRANSDGVDLPTLAKIMADLGCTQAFNLDGGNSATMVFNGGYTHTKTKANERAQSDMIYFASAIKP